MNFTLPVSMRHAFFFLLMLLAPQSAFSQQAFPPFDTGIETRIDSLFGDVVTEGPGYAVGIIQEGALIWHKGYGMANLDYQIPLSSKTVFNVASLSKQFTAAALALLILEGKVSLDDPVQHHLPEFPDYPGPVRIKHLVYMTSGIPEYYQQERPGGKSWSSDYFTVDDAIAASLAQPELEFLPGTAWAYSNVNYMLITQIVESVSGLPFSRFAKERIFQPLGMIHTHVNDDVTRIVPNRATGYNNREGGGYTQHARLSPHFGGSGVFTTIEDLARWDRNFETHALAGEAFTNLMLSRIRFEHDKDNDAFGLVWGEWASRPTLWYEGGDLGFSSYMARFPDDRFTVICLSNLGTGFAAGRARAIIDIFLQESR